MSLLSLTHPAAWIALLAAGRRPAANELYRVVTYDPSDGVRQLRSFEGLFRVVSSRGTFGPTPVSRSLSEALGARRNFNPRNHSHQILDSHGDVRGVVGLRPDGTWITALDTDGDGVADVIHMITPDALGHIFANPRGREAMRDWMEYGRNPFCIPGLNPDTINVGAAIMGCGSGQRGGTSATPGGGSADTVGGSQGSAAAIDLWCRDVPEGGPPPGLAGGGIRGKPGNTPRRPPARAARDFYAEAEAEADELSRRYWHRRLFEAMIEMLEDDGVSQDSIDELRAIERDIRLKDEGIPRNPYRPLPDDATGLSESLARLCAHWRNMQNNPSLIEQMKEALNTNCTDPAGNPDPDARTGSDCGRFRVDPIEDLLEMVGSEECAEDGHGECEPTSITDRLDANARRHWSALAGIEVAEPCNPLVCGGLFDAASGASGRYGSE